MKLAMSIAGVVLGALMLAGGLLFLCAATRQPGRLLLALILLALGVAFAAWGGFSLRRQIELSPKRLADRITDLAASSGEGEITLDQAVSHLNVPADSAQNALDLLSESGRAYRERRGDRYFYLFPGLKESKVVRRCPYCGAQFSVREPLTKCPNCGGPLELVKK